MLGPIARYRSAIIFFVLFVIGVALIGASNTFHHEWMKVQLDRLMAEIGALILVVGMLHWFFEFGLRQEMLRDVARTTVGSAHVHQCGIDTCSMNARDVDDRVHWSQATNLTIGYQYSPTFFKNFHEVFRERCRHKLSTTIILLQPEGAAARYLRDSTAGNPNIRQAIGEIVGLFREIDPNGTYCRIVFHDRVLRYSFIQTDENVWVKFYANSPERATVPAFKVRADSPLFKFFSDDKERMLGHSREKY